MLTFGFDQSAKMTRCPETEQNIFFVLKFILDFSKKKKVGDNSDVITV